MPIGRALSAGLSGTRLHGPEPVPVAVLDTDRAPVFEVTDETGLRAARRMTGGPAARVAVPKTTPRPVIPAAAT